MIEVGGCLCDFCGDWTSDEEAWEYGFDPDEEVAEATACTDCFNRIMAETIWATDTHAA